MRWRPGGTTFKRDNFQEAIIVSKRVLTALLTISVLSAVLVTAAVTQAGAQAIVTGAPDPETAGVFLFTAGTDTGNIGVCDGTPGGTPTNDIVRLAVDNDILAFIGDTPDEIASYQPGSGEESPAGTLVDATIDKINEGLTDIDDFGNIRNGNDDTSNADIGVGGRLEVRLPPGEVIAPDGIATTGNLIAGTDPEANLAGFEIFMFEDAELSGMTVTLQGPTQSLSFDLADRQLNPNTAAGADDMLLAIDLDTLAGWTDPYVVTVAFVDDAIDGGSFDSCPNGGQADTSVEIDAIATRKELLVLTPSVDIEKLTNGQDADVAPGPDQNIDDAIVWEYVVTNDGQQPLTGITVVDDVEGPIACPADALAVGASMTCTATGVATQLGGYTNTATVTATPETGGDVTDADPSNYNVPSRPAIDLEKFVNGDDADTAPGLLIDVNGTIFFRYDVTNIGNGPLVDIVVTDDILGSICTIAVLDVGATDSCIQVDAADEGLVTNIGTAVGIGPNGTQVSDVDPGNYTGQSLPDLQIEKRVNGVDANTAPGPNVDQGEIVTWTYEVTNSGNVTISDIAVTDDIEGPVCTIDSLAAGQSETCTLTGAAVAGQYTNIGSVTGTDPSGARLTDTDPANYFAAGPSIDVEKSTNGQDADVAPGPSIAVGETVTWTYDVTNTGNVALTAVTVSDNVEGQVCVIAVLAAGASETCSLDGVATAGAYTNTATVVGVDPSGSGVNDADPSNYFGGLGALGIEKSTNGSDADNIPGPTLLVGSEVVWEYVVTNEGNTVVTNVVVVDNLEGDVCTVDELAPGASVTCDLVGVATLGQYENIGTATGLDPDGNQLFDSDPSNYMGADTGITLEKLTNGEDADDAPGVLLVPGDDVEWTYIVTNLGNLPVTNLDVTDDIIGDICSFATLGAGASRTCTARGTAAVGPYLNNGSVTAVGPNNTPLAAEDPSNYLGLDPALSVEKSTNGEDADAAGEGPQVRVGDAVTWTYVVSNDGNVALTNVVVSDDVEGEICTVATLDVGASETCSLTGVAVAGDYVNTATVTGTDPAGNAVTNTDPSRYEGLQSGLDLEKLTNGVAVPAGESGPFVAEGDPVVWTYIASNFGNSTLTNVVITDNQEGLICTIETLAGGAAETCTAEGVADAGQYNNAAAVTGLDPLGNTVGAEDTSAYFGAGSGLTVEKATNGQDADTAAEGPLVPVGAAVTWTYVITNNGNVDLVGVDVVDDQVGDICTIGALAVGDSRTCTADGVATEGRYVNEATASGITPTGETVDDTDPSHYFGANPGIGITKLVDGEAAPGDGPVLPVGSEAEFTFIVVNTGNVALDDVAVTDSVFGDVCTIGRLDVLAEQTCALTWTVEAGQHRNTATATGTDPTGQNVSDEDAANVFGSGPGIAMEKSTNDQDSDTAPGEGIAVGDAVTWTYEVTNTGNVELVDVVVTDDREGRICEIASLAIDETAFCVEVGVAGLGAYRNVGTATAQTPQGTPVEDADPSNYVGVVGALGNYVWLDLNADGVQDEGEPGIEGVLVELSAAGETAVLATTSTDASGRYRFDGLAPGDYGVNFVLDGAAWTAIGAGTDDALDSDVDAEGRVASATVPVSAANLDVDAGVLPGAIGDFVWLDEDSNGLQGDAEPGIAGVNVALFVDQNGDGVADGLPIATTVTDADGSYAFEGLDAREDFIVSFASVDETFRTDSGVGTDPAVDSDANSSTGVTPVVTVGWGETNGTIDAGYVPNPGPGSIGDTVWLDANNNGTRDAGEVGVADVDIELRLPNGDVWADTTTDEDGLYLFENLPEGRYDVVVDPATLPAGLIQTSDLNGPLDGSSREDLLESEEAALDHDFGYLELATIGDFVWNDEDGDGIQGAVESGVPGVTVTLWTAADDGQPGNEIGSVQSGPDGEYLFDRIDPREDYVVQVTLPDGWILTEVTAGEDPTVDSNINPNTGLSEVLRLDAGELNLTIDIGVLRAPASIGDVVWMDLNENGVQDTDENPIPNATLNLWTVNEDGSPKDQIATDTTDENGLYLFVGLNPDTDYVVQVVDIDGWSLTNADQGPSDDIDSDVDPNTGISAVVGLEPGEEDLTIDVGLLPRQPEIELVVLSESIRVDEDFEPVPVKTEGENVTLTYTSTNTGDWDLIDVTVTDTEHGEICVIPSLKMGESDVCTLVVTAPIGKKTATATTQGDPVDADGNPAEQLDGTPVSSVDDDEFLGYEGTRVLPTAVVPSATPTATPVPPTPTPVPVTPIAITGANSSSLALVALGLLGAGATMLLMGRRRHAPFDTN